MIDRNQQMVAGTAWEEWPRWLHERAHDALARLQGGQPDDALEVLDGLIADLDERRRALADLANRQYQPSTDDRGWAE